jgi:hypothetical protein
MKVALLILGIITTGILIMSFGNKNSSTQLKQRVLTKVNITNTYIYKPIDYNDIDIKNLDLLTDVEFYILECTKNTTFSFYGIGGWVRDRVNKL